MYILNIDKSKSHTTPQIVGRVADLPYSPLEVQVFDGMEVLDLTGYTIEFRGVTSTNNKVMISSGFKTTNAKNGEFEFTFPKNFYSAPGKFKRAYFVVKKNGKTDSTQDMLIHVLDSVDIELQDAEDIFEGLDKIIKEVEAQAKKDVDRIIKQIEKDTASTIADSNKKLSELDKQMNDFKNNTNQTISSINNSLNSSNEQMKLLSDRLSKLESDINSQDVLTISKLNETNTGGYNYFAMAKEPWHSYIEWNEYGGYFQNTSTSQAFALLNTHKLGLPLGRDYIFSVELMNTSGDVKFAHSSLYINSSISTKHNAPTLKKGEWVRVYGRFHYDVEKTNERLHLYFVNLKNKGDLLFRKFSFQESQSMVDWSEAPEDLVTSYRHSTPGNNIIEEVTSKTKKVTVPQWHIPVTERYNLLENDIRPGDTITFGSMINVPSNASDSVCVRVNFWTDDPSDYTTYVSKSIKPGEMGRTSMSVTVPASKFKEVSLSFQKQANGTVGDIPITYSHLYLNRTSFDGMWTPSYNHLQKQIDDLKKAVTALGGS